MNEVELIGYTRDLRFLVLELHGSAGSRRLRLPVDPDLVATLDEIRDQRDDLPDLEWYVGAATETAGETDGDGSDGDGSDEVESDEEEAAHEPGPVPDDGSSDAAAPAADAVPAEREDEGRSAPDGADGAASTLTPAQIQALLRSGRSVSSVAKAAETDVEWVERWLPPIVAERDQVLREARRLRLNRARLGESRRPLGEAVERNLAERGVQDDDVTWTASRRADGRWSVGVRYRHRGRARSASWTLDREAGALSAASELARDLGWFRADRARKAKETARGKASKRPATPARKRG